jgi:excisionase family DNA binding protein
VATVKGPGKPGRRVVTVEEAGEMLGLKRSTAYRCAKAGQIPTVRLGRYLKVPLDALENLLQGVDPTLGVEADG